MIAGRTDAMDWPARRWCMGKTSIISWFRAWRVWLFNSAVREHMFRLILYTR
jgi:hypothetical protein